MAVIKNKMRTGFFAILIAFALTSCSTMVVREKFEDSISQYSKLLSAQRFDLAGIFVSESIAEAFNARVKTAKNIKVVDCRVVKAKYEEENGKADVEVEIDYYTLSAYKLTTLTDLQKWAYVTENGATGWKLMSLLPEFP